MNFTPSPWISNAPYWVQPPDQGHQLPRTTSTP
jgi:hypothetical protein